MKGKKRPDRILSKTAGPMSFFQKLGCLAVVMLMLVVFAACGSDSGANNGYQPAVTQAYGGQYADGNDTVAGNDAVKDWMKDQANGKNYGYDDGGSYYCMGKNDTCPNKTNNKYDLYCNSCDPDGDNIEG